MTYRDIPVLEVRPEPEYKRTLNWIANTVDSRTGARTFDDCRTHSMESRQYSFVCSTRAEVDSLRTFFRALNGRKNPFWMPSGNTDLVLHAAAGQNTSILQIESCGYVAYAWSLAHLHDLYIRPLAGGEAQIRRITAASQATGYELLSLSAPLSAAVTVTGHRISYLSLCRQASDTLTTQWHSSGVATITVDVADIPWEVPA